MYQYLLLPLFTNEPLYCWLTFYSSHSYIAYSIQLLPSPLATALSSSYREALPTYTSIILYFTVTLFPAHLTPIIFVYSPLSLLVNQPLYCQAP